MATLAEIKDSRKGHKMHNKWARWSCYPASNYIAWLCIKLRISANQVTIFSGITEVAACVMFAFGSYQMSIAGACLILLYLTLDLTDGTIARVTKTVSGYGHFLDLAIGFVLPGLVPLCVGLGLYLKTDAWLWLFLGGFCAFSWYLGTTILYAQGTIASHKLHTPGSSKMEKWHIAQPEVPVLVICATVNYLEAFLVLFTAMYVARVMGIMYVIRKEMRKSDDRKANIKNI